MTTGNLGADRLTCERVRSPLGVDEARPVFGWVPVAGRPDENQRAYQVLVASAPELLIPAVADLWDSGPIGSDLVNGVRYDGRPLVSRQQCWWTVRLWDKDGDAGPVAPPATFEVGLVQTSDWVARWIGGDGPGAAPLLRRDFTLPEGVVRARAYVTGVGHYELRLNGAKVGDRVLDPATTTYGHDPGLRDADRQPARIRSPRVLYAVHDVTEQLESGANTVGLVLGHGWYSSAENRPEGLRRPWGDRPRGLVQIEVALADGRTQVVASDATWGQGPGPITYDDPIHGEHHDARLEPTGWDTSAFDDALWRPAAILDPPGGALRSQVMAPVRVIETRSPERIEGLRDGVQIIDFGQHVSGWTRITVSGPAGGQVVLRHAGQMGEDGELDDSANMAEHSPARQTDTYTLGGGPATWEPRFTLHGFRYVEVTTTGGAHVDEVEARVVHSDVGPGGTFSSASALLNQIDQNVRWTYRASFQGVPQDAADRGERVGWLGDPGWIIEDFLYCFDTLAYWSKWLDDIRDTQLPDGSVPIATPIHWRGRTGMDFLPGFPYAKWPDFSAATYAVIAWHLYSYYGDRSILEQHYDGLRAALDWTSSLEEQGIVGAGFGDHMEPLPDGSCSPLAELTPIALTSTAWYYATADIVARAAHVLGDAVGEETARSRAEAIRSTFNRTFFDADAGRYADGSQTAQALPLWLGLVPDEHRDAVGRNLLERIDRDGGHLVTGTMGTPALEQVLADLGAPEVMLQIATWEDFPGWGFQVAQGATTVWETWGHAATKYPSSSRNMKLLAAISKFLYKDVAGISPLAPGWRRVLVKPCLTHHLDHAAARLETPRGEAAIAWRRRGETLTVDVTVPATSTAEVVLPLPAADGVVEERGTVLWADGRATPRPGLRDLLPVDGSLHLEAGGGSYRFTIRGEASSG